MIDNMLPRNLDDLYGPGAENADDGIDEEKEWIEIPQLLVNLARALPMPICPPDHELREAVTYCKSCDESRDELQQLVADGDLNAVAIVVGVYLRRLYVAHEQIGAAIRDYCLTSIKANEMEMWKQFYNLKNVFAEVLSDDDRDIPSGDEAVRMINELLKGVEL